MPGKFQVHSWVSFGPQIMDCQVFQHFYNDVGDLLATKKKSTPNRVQASCPVKIDIREIKGYAGSNERS